MKKTVRQWLAAAMSLCLLMAMLPLSSLSVGAAVTTPIANLISNPGFEAEGKNWQTGQDEPDVHWNKYLSTAVKGEAAHSGDYGMHIQGPGNWDGMLTAVVAVEPGSTYDYSFWYKVVSSAVTMKITGVQTGVDYISQALTRTDWTQYENVFTIGNDTTLLVVFCGANTGTTESAYVDDFKLTFNKKGTVNYVANGDFENGNINGWSKSSLIASANVPVVNSLGGAYAMKIELGGWGYTNYKVPVTPNTDYVLTFSILSQDKKNLCARIRNQSDNADLVNKTWRPSSTAWETVTLEFNSGDSTSVHFRFQEFSGGAAVHYVDNAVMVSKKNAADNSHLVNGGFETGDMSQWNKSQSTVISESAAYTGDYGANLKGDGGWGGMLYRNIAVEAGATYRVSLWYKVNQNGVNVQVKDGGTSGPDLKANWVTKQEWTQLVYEVVPTTTTLCINFCGGGNGVAEDVYVDDVDVVKLEAPTTDGYLTNGSFETGDITGWDGDASAISFDAAHVGNFGAHLQNTGWGGMMAQTLLNVEEGKSYRVTMDIRAITNGVNINVKRNASDSNLASKYFSVTSYSNGDTKAAGNWQQLSMNFRANSDTAVLQFVGAGNGLQSNVYVDNIKVELIPDTLQNIFTYNGKSAMEMDDRWLNEQAGKGGLAFMHTVNVSGMQINETLTDYPNGHGATYKANTAITHPYTNSAFSNPYNYKVVKVGAVLSFTTSNADDLVWENATNKGGIIDIEGKKCWNLTDSTYQYVVRIINIPTNHFGTEIYCRPYVIIETENGTRQETIYGDVVSGNYDDTTKGPVPQL